ncbi:isocitrate lyase/phosphoenolpyruvate mutase family protein [Pendulispora brunnea]|uniref:Isocitrate lyase/phosphoenolpyruvate mutase family protein n=1 Tax=Pendulispora brunnea TaxID=2905690 RepID=A0ABZ2K837_9BACT
MPKNITAAATFRRLHDARNAFVMPNAWDAGSAIVLAEAGFSAIATTSAGIAFSLGRGDHSVPQGATAVSKEEMFDRIRQITAAVDVPVNGDLENGYGARPEAVVETIRLAIDAGLAGGNIEDYERGTLYDESLGAERIAAAREAIAKSGTDFVLTARTDGLLLDTPSSLSDAIRRANRYRLAGADCLFVPGVKNLDDIATMVREIDGPVNVVAGLTTTALIVADLRAAGVARVSLGGSFARAALGFLREGARELFEHGTLHFAEKQISQRELNTLFAKRDR